MFVKDSTLPADILLLILMIIVEMLLITLCNMLEFCKKIEKKMELCVINEFIPCYPFYQLHVGLHLSRR